MHGSPTRAGYLHNGPHSGLLLGLVMVLGVLSILTAVDTTSAEAAGSTPPRVMLTGGAAQVGRTYTASLREADGVTPWTPAASTYVTVTWLRGSKSGTYLTPISGATGPTYTLSDADHWHTIQAWVRVRSSSTGAVVGERKSAVSNYVLWDLTPPVFLGQPLVGGTLSVQDERWIDDWDTTFTWRRDMEPIAGADGPARDHMSYALTPADGGTGLSLLALCEWTYPNGVHPIDRKASFIRVRWGTAMTVSLTSPKVDTGRVAVSLKTTYPGLPATQLDGSATVTMGTKVLGTIYIRDGAGVATYTMPTGWRRVKVVLRESTLLATTTTIKGGSIR